jgi:hypothetical protein
MCEDVILSQAQCLTPVILSTWEAKSESILVQGQPREFKKLRFNKQLSTVLYACHPKLCERLRWGGSRLETSLGNKKKKKKKTVFR